MTETEPPPSPDLPSSDETVAFPDDVEPPEDAALDDTAFDDSPLADSGTPTRPVRKLKTPRSGASPPPKKQIVLRVASVAALLLCLGWGVVQIRDLFNAKRQGVRITNTGQAPAEPAPTADPATSGDAPGDPLLEDPEEATYLGLPARMFLRTHVKQIDLDSDNGDGEIVRLADGALGLQTVTVVNLWATWCDPCKEEFSLFQNMFTLNQRDRGWGSETRFVPILVDDPENARTAYRTWKTSMPPIHAALVDLQLDQGGVRGALAQIDKLAPKQSLPITLLFDCRRKIRWSRMSALDEEAFIILANEIDKLRAELRQDKCRIKRPVQPAQQPPPPPEDTDPPPLLGTMSTPARKPCNAKRLCGDGENCNNRCCRCPIGVKCLVRRESGIGICPGGLD